MRHDFKRVVGLTAIFLLLAPLAWAGLSPEYRDWIDSPEAFLLTKKEIKEWKHISTDAEAKHFIDLFWARRNPHPEAAFNEFKARFESMVKYCDENFGYEGKRGALSDRGKVFLLMGPPHYKESRAPTQTVTVAATEAGQDDRGTDEARANVAMWVYDPARMNPAFKAKGSRIVFTFYENRPETNEFIMDRSHREATMAMRLLSRAPEVYLLHPELDTVPKPVSVPGGTPATPEQLQVLKNADTGPLQDKLSLRQDLGVADAIHRPLWVHLEFPGDVQVLDLLAGEVSTADGSEVISNFQLPAKAVTAGDRRAYDLTFPLGPGKYSWRVGGFAGGALQFVARGEVEIPESSEGVWMSPVWLGLEAEKIEKPVLGMAYSFGSWHLFPLTGSTAPHKAQLSYFGYVVHPQVEEGKQPKAKLKLTLRKDGKRLGRPLSIDLPLARITDGVYLYANAISLAALPAGSCELDFVVLTPGAEEPAARKVKLDLVD